MLWSWILLLNFFYFCFNLLYINIIIMKIFHWKITLYINFFYSNFLFSRKSKLNRNVPSKRLSKYYYHDSIYFYTYKSFFNQNSIWSTRKIFSVIATQYPSPDTCTQNNSIQASNTPHSHVTMRTTSQPTIYSKSLPNVRLTSIERMEDMRFQALR